MRAHFIDRTNNQMRECFNHPEPFFTYRKNRYLCLTIDRMGIKVFSRKKKLPNINLDHLLLLKLIKAVAILATALTGGVLAKGGTNHKTSENGRRIA